MANFDIKNSSKAANSEDNLSAQMKSVGIPQRSWKSLPSGQYSSPARTPDEALDRVKKGVEFFAYGQRNESNARQEALKDIQTKLNKVLCSECKAVQVTGVFDADTRALVCLFQKRYDLGRSPDGIVGRMTLKRLNAEYSKLSPTAVDAPDNNKITAQVAQGPENATPQSKLPADTLPSAKLPTISITTAALPTSHAPATPERPKQIIDSSAPQKQEENLLKQLEDMSQTLNRRENGADAALKQLNADYADHITQNTEKGLTESLADRATGRDNLYEVRTQTFHDALDYVSTRRNNIAVAKSLIDEYRDKARTNSLSPSDIQYAKQELKQSRELAQSPTLDPAIFKRGQEDAEKLYPGIEERDTIAPYAIVGGITAGVAAGWYAAGARAVMLTSSLIRSCHRAETQSAATSPGLTEKTPTWNKIDSQKPVGDSSSRNIPPENQINPFSDSSNPPTPRNNTQTLGTTEKTPAWSTINSQKPVGDSSSSNIPPENQINPFSDSSNPPTPPNNTQTLGTTEKTPAWSKIDSQKPVGDSSSSNIPPENQINPFSNSNTGS